MTVTGPALKLQVRDYDEVLEHYSLNTRGSLAWIEVFWSWFVACSRDTGKLLLEELCPLPGNDEIAQVGCIGLAVGDVSEGETDTVALLFAERDVRYHCKAVARVCCGKSGQDQLISRDSIRGSRLEITHAFIFAILLRVAAIIMPATGASR
jgi:hypothetical protein